MFRLAWGTRGVGASTILDHTAVSAATTWGLGVEGVPGNVYRNGKAVFYAVDRTMRMCLSANRLLSLGETVRREVKRSK